PLLSAQQLLMHTLIDRALHPFSSFFFLPAPAPTGTYPLSLHDALPISIYCLCRAAYNFRIPVHPACSCSFRQQHTTSVVRWPNRSEEHTSELQSRENLVCRLLLVKKKSGGGPHGDIGAVLSAFATYPLT